MLSAQRPPSLLQALPLSVIAVHLDPTRALLRAGPKSLVNTQTALNAKVSRGYTPLMFACEGGVVPIVELLVERKADPLLKNADGKTAVELLDKSASVYDTLLPKLEDLAKDWSSGTSA